MPLLDSTLTLHPETLRMFYFCHFPPNMFISLGLVLMVKLEYIILRDPLPALTVYTVQVDLATAIGITERGLVDGAAAKIASLLDGQVTAVATIKDSIGIHRT